MKKCVLLLIFSLLAYQSYSQSCGQDFVIVVDGKVPVPSYISRVKIQITDSLDREYIIDRWYMPGNLEFTESDHEKIAQSKDLKLFFSVQTEYGKPYKHYEIEADKRMFGRYYCVLYIYDLDLRANHKIYEPLDKNRNYTFDYIIPGYGTVRMRKNTKITKRMLDYITVRD